MIPEEFVRRIPKTDLHVHLDGSLRLSTLIELAKGRGVELPSDSEEGLLEKVFKPKYGNLPEYLAGFRYTVAVMQDAEALERVACELVEDNVAEGVRYLEIRFAPQLHISATLSFRDVMKAVTDGCARAKKAHNESAAVKSGKDLPVEVGIIVCALRWFNGHMSEYYHRLFSVMSYAREKAVFAAASLELARAATRVMEQDGFPIVGLDLAGAENGYPANDHRDAYLHAHRHFLSKTVHAGEAYGPESIFQALTDCFANRIGHGTFLFAPEQISDPTIVDREAYVHSLVDYVAKQRITIEVNVTSNLQTLPQMTHVSQHPLQKMIDNNLSATICTDNRLVSRTTVTDELLLVTRAFQVTRRQFRNLVIAGFKGSFYPAPYRLKRAFVRQVIDRYDQVEREFFPPEAPF